MICLVFVRFSFFSCSHNDLPWQYRQYAKNKVYTVNLDQDTRQQWGPTVPMVDNNFPRIPPQTDIPRLRAGKLAAQVPKLYLQLLYCSSTRVITVLYQSPTRGRCMKLILVRCVLELTVRPNLHLFYQYRCFLLLFTERCMNNHTTINFILALSHVLSDSIVKT